MASASYDTDPHVRHQSAALVARIRSNALRRGEDAFRDLARVLGALPSPDAVAGEKTVDVRLTNEEVKKKLRSFGVAVGPADAQLLHAAFRDDVGYVLVHRLVAALSDTLCGARSELVDAAFATVDRAGSGVVTVDALVDAYNPHGADALVRAGDRTADDARRRFAQRFDAARNPDGRVTRGDFVLLYAAVSANVASDAEFAELLRATWQLDEARPEVRAPRALLPEPCSRHAGDTAHGGTASSASITAAAAAAGGGGGTAAAAQSLLRGAPFGGSITTAVEGSGGFHCPKRIAGYTGHVPLAQERYGETFHQVESQTPALPKKPKTWLVGSFVDEANAMVHKGNRANAHSFKFA